MFHIPSRFFSHKVILNNSFLLPLNKNIKKKYFLVFRYYCEIGSNRTTEYICPAGSYCPEGSPSPTPCPAGTYSNTEGMTNSSSCTLCDPGKYCNDTGKILRKKYYVLAEQNP